MVNLKNRLFLFSLYDFGPRFSVAAFAYSALKTAGIPDEPPNIFGILQP